MIKINVIFIEYYRTDSGPVHCESGVNFRGRAILN